MQSHGIVLVGTTRFLPETFKRVIHKVDDLEVVCEAGSITGLPSVLSGTEAQWVVLFEARGDDLSEDVERVLRSTPRVRLLMVASDGSEIRMRWMEAHEQVMSISSVQDLVEVLRSEEQARGGISDASKP